MSCFVQSIGRASFAMKSPSTRREPLRKLLEQKELIEVLELNVQPDHLHMVIWIPPKYAALGSDGVLERETRHAAVPKVRTVRAAVLGQAPVGARLLRQHGRIG